MSQVNEPPEPQSPEPQPLATGRLFVVATPIGNLDDVTLRALATLRRADGILAEDTRHTRKLCTHHGITTPLSPFHAHSSEHTLAQCIERLRAGKVLALVSDAGTPLISDPGAALVQAAREAGIPVEVLPGASAVTTALCAAGIPFDAYRFVGFLARSGSRRTRMLETIADAPEATVLFEAPGRLAKTLSDLMQRTGPNRRVAVCRELTKLHEEVVSGTIDQVHQRFERGTLGEITLIVARSDAAEHAPSEADLDRLIASRLAAGDSARDIARTLSSQFELSRRALYARVLDVAKGEAR